MNFDFLAQGHNRICVGKKGGLNQIGGVRKIPEVGKIYGIQKWKL